MNTQNHHENHTNENISSEVKFIYMLTGILSFSILFIYPLSMLLAAILQAKFQG